MLKRVTLTLLGALLIAPAAAADTEREADLRNQLEQALREARIAQDRAQVAEDKAREALAEAERQRAVAELAKNQAQRQAALAENRLAEALDQAQAAEARARDQAEESQRMAARLALEKAKQDVEANQAAPQAEWRLAVFRLENATLEDVMPVLSELLPPGDDAGMKYAPYERTNSLIVRGTPAALEQLGELLQELDRDK